MRLKRIARVPFIKVALVLLSLGLFDASAATTESADWSVYLGGEYFRAISLLVCFDNLFVQLLVLHGSVPIHAPLQQINRGNVSELEVAWTFETGDKGEYQANNLIVDGVLYTPSPSRKIQLLCRNRYVARLFLTMSSFAIRHARTG